MRWTRHILAAHTGSVFMRDVFANGPDLRDHCTDFMRQNIPYTCNVGIRKEQKKTEKRGSRGVSLGSRSPRLYTTHTNTHDSIRTRIHTYTNINLSTCQFTKEPIFL